MEILTECPNCQGKEFSPFNTCIDYTVSNETFNLVKCKTCGFVFTNPRPDSSEIVRYYESDDYISHSNTNKGLINKIYHFVKKQAINNKIKLIEDLKTSNKTILDIGCGTGSFLNEIKNAGWKVKGIEPSVKARTYAINNFKLDVTAEDSIKSLPNNSFAIISMWHVLEHVHNLNDRISEIYNLLESNGYAIIAVPNYTSKDASIYNKHWAAFDVPRHLYHFSPEIIKQLFQKQKLTWVKSLPMKMDSFYVSMLSEKYQKGSLQLPKAFYSGLISNLSAKGDAEKYSSVIYIFQKK